MCACVHYSKQAACVHHYKQAACVHYSKQAACHKCNNDLVLRAIPDLIPALTAAPFWQVFADIACCTRSILQTYIVFHWLFNVPRTLSRRPTFTWLNFSLYFTGVACILQNSGQFSRPTSPDLGNASKSWMICI